MIAIDPQDSLDDWGLEPWSSETLKRLDNGQPVRIQAVPPIDLVGAAEFYQEVFKRAFETPDGNVIVYIDELFAVVDANPNSSAMRAVYTRGRKLGVSVVAVTQRPTGIPLFVLSETQHSIMFRLFLDDDRKRMRQMMGDNVMRGIPADAPFGFYYRHASWPEAKFHPGLSAPDTESLVIDLKEFAE